MKKQFLTVLLALFSAAALGCLAACGGGSGTKPTPTPGGGGGDAPRYIGYRIAGTEIIEGSKKLALADTRGGGPEQ